MAYKDIAAAWVNKDKNGKTYLSVVLKQDMKEGDKIFLRKNDYKTKDGQPDYRYSIRVEEEGEVQAEKPAVVKAEKPVEPEHVDTTSDDEIPF